ncbi:transcriptional regulator, XRE family [Desulfofarcimen acetoxidans DSM 771]|uniref:Transcriptional regulator, XRE family n=1 Tax=Desulfofarcimen acetoxidans (strain ATCC 49208 / DSM 771 / KCTC 5769 / VKM B-1644 / 5575) TaxID=485916 RepID=C8VVR8_DESAS|nr:helix-turn-helix transcriptional regulator [Desulfofarcimen acetoxidans]ACV62383.1 transcriptional regulator, XRE family [Desulfofarcimen acetoxidans DSM 771]
MELNNSDRLGSILKTARKTKGLTREQLAEIINITPRYLMSIENESKKPSYDVLFRLIRELGIPADTIFYPENQNIDTEVEHLVRLLYLCNERELKIATATIQALVDNKQ